MAATSEYIDTPIVAYNSSYHPTTQSFWITLQDGTTQVEVGVPDIDALRLLSVYHAISQAAQVGAASVLLAAIFLMTKGEKRRSSVFILNTLSLILVIVRGVFQLATLTGPFYEWWRWKTHTYNHIGNAKAVSACGEVSSSLLTVAILCSLFVQVKIVCCSLSDVRRYIVNASNAIVITVAIAMRFAVTVMNITWTILDLSGMSYDHFVMVQRFASGANITLVLSIAFSTVIFTAKLAAAIMARRSIGMKQFGPMQIIFVMGCQTMFTPLIFTIVTYTSIVNANIQSFVPTIVAISLPLSGMWAAVNTNNIHVANPDPRKHRVVPLGASNGTYGSSVAKGASADSTYYDDDKYDVTASPKKAGRVNSDPDLEMQKLSDGVNVERTYSVRSD